MNYCLPFDFSKMCAIFKLIWVRKLIGKLGVPYNRRLRVRGSPIHSTMTPVYRFSQWKATLSAISRE
jgi:hypothetical protein